MSEIKQANFRIAQESADAFRAFCEEKGWNQAQGFDHLLQVLELDQAKATVPERALEISDFEAHVQALLGAYVQSVSLAANTEDRIRMEFSRRLESKDETIATLQADLKDAKDRAAEAAEIKLQMLSKQGDYAQAQADLATLQDRAAYLQGQVEQIEQAKMTMERLLTARLESAEARAADSDALRHERDQLVAAMKEQARENEISAERAARAAERAQDAAVAAEKAKGNAEASRLKEALQEARIKASEDLRASEERAHESDRAAAAEIRALEQRIAALQQELAMRPKAEC